MAPRPVIGLALGGGAARGLAHLGVLEVLEREGVPIDLIAATSMGSLVGAVYASQPRAAKLIKKAVQFYASPEFTGSRIHNLRRGEQEDLGFFDSVSQSVRKGLALSSQVTRISYLEREDLLTLLRPFVDDRDIRSLPIPLGIVTCDLTHGEQRVLKKGSLIEAIAASSAIPGAFPPFEIDGAACVDGGVVNMVPISVAREMGADVVIAVNVSHDSMQPAELKRALEVYFHTHEITKKVLISLQLRDADVVITPEVGEHHWADFSAAARIIDAGREAAELALRDIKRVLRPKPKRFWHRFQLSRRSGARHGSEI